MRPELAAVFVSSTGVGLLMVLAGLQKSTLEWRRPRRHCPSCGRQIEWRRCRCTS